MRSSLICFVTIAAVVAAGCGRDDEKNAVADVSKKNDVPVNVQQEKAAHVPAELPEVVVNDGCGINSPEPGKSYDRTVFLPAWGYAYDADGGTIPSKVTLRITSSNAVAIVVPAVRGNRHDVAIAFGRPELEESGFGAEVDITSLSPGQYTFSVIQELREKRIVCNSSAPFTVR
jgi:hypothetical protein